MEGKVDMKNMSTILVSSLILVLLSLASGCQEQDRLASKKMGLVADENLRLIRKLNNCDELLAKQAKLLRKCEAAKAAAAKRMAAIAKWTHDEKAMQLTNLTMEALEDCKKENAELSSRIETFISNITDLQKQVLDLKQQSQ